MPGTSRRSFVRALMGGGIGLLAAACAPAAPTAPTAGPQPPQASKPTTPAQPTAAAAQPTTPAQAAPSTAKAVPKTQRLVIALAAPSRESNSFQRDIPAPGLFQLRAMYENLIGTDPQTGNAIPELAERWQVEPNGKDVRFFLRKGVQFHGGFGEFTARDVVHTFTDLTQPPGSQATWASAVGGVVDHVEVINDYEVVFRNKVTNASLLWFLSGATAGMEIASKADYDARGYQPGQFPSMTEKPLAGTGPYQFQERVADRYVRFERVPYQHWRVQPDFAELEIRFLRENATRQAALAAGEAHLTVLPNDLVAGMEARGFRSIAANTAGTQVFLNILGSYLKDPANSDELVHPDTPTNNIQVRRALNKAVNRDAINAAFYAGKGEPMHLLFYHSTWAGWDPSFESRFPELYGYDPAAARDLLREAGFGSSNPPRVTVNLVPDPAAPEGNDVLEAIAGMFSEAGFEAPIEAHDPAQYGTKRRDFLFPSGVDFNTSSAAPLVPFRIVYTSQFATRGQAVERRRMDQAYTRVLGELDDARREPLWRELGKTVYEHIPNIPIVRVRAQVLVDPKVVSAYSYPGAQQTFLFSHFENIKSA